jgi:hypothetical protein
VHIVKGSIGPTFKITGELQRVRVERFVGLIQFFVWGNIVFSLNRTSLLNPNINDLLEIFF